MTMSNLLNNSTVTTRLTENPAIVVLTYQRIEYGNEGYPVSTVRRVAFLVGSGDDYVRLAETVKSNRYDCSDLILRSCIKNIETLVEAQPLSEPL